MKWGWFLIKLTATTMIEPQIVLQRERMLPQVGELIGSIGSEVTPMQVVGRSQIAGGYVVVNASEQLDLAPDMLTAYLRVGEGDLVETGDVLLRRGRWGTKVVAPAAGRVHAVQNGRLLLQRPFVWHELRALLRGTIINQLPQRGVVIETTGAYIQGRWGTQQEGFGRLRLLTETAEGILTAESWQGELERRVVVAGQVSETAVLHQAAENNIAGLIVGTMPASLIPFAQTLPFPLIVTDGFGQPAMSEIIFNLLKKLDNRETMLFGKMDEDKGNRPEIIVATGVPSHQTLRPPAPLAVGQTVRLLRQPYAQQLGKVVKLFEQAQALETGIYTPGAAVKLANGQVVFVPDANLDVIQMSG